MHLGDYTIIFMLALIMFGPKKLPEIARQIAKLMAEFRRASNEFKTQIDEELRSSEQAERQKQISATTAAAPEPVILPPAVGAPVSQYAYGDPAETERPDRSLDSGWSAASSGESNGQAAESAASLQPVEAAPLEARPEEIQLRDAQQQEAGALKAVEAADLPVSAAHAGAETSLGSLFREPDHNFGLTYGSADEANAATAVPVEGTASENAQASIHHG